MLLLSTGKNKTKAKQNTQRSASKGDAERNLSERRCQEPSLSRKTEKPSSPQEANSVEMNMLECRWGGEAPFPEPSKEWRNFFVNLQTQQRDSPYVTRKGSPPTAPALPQVRRRTREGTNSHLWPGSLFLKCTSQNFPQVVCIHILKALNTQRTGKTLAK